MKCNLDYHTDILITSEKLGKKLKSNEKGKKAQEKITVI
jgi:hypothetical protein